ncbi:S8 family serine peptidase [Nitrosomonas nitrosa]|uniref:S8 family serine peptidase n=1 Tax=Nitrosomonas nitrosa TaxID=52442 RepID=UPI0023F94C2F|nr:S8 family serine peptidase [Nitrosomonas nitrosa]
MNEEWARGRILVMPRAGLPAQVFASILKEHDGKARKIGQSNLYVVALPEYTEEGVHTRLEHHPHLKFAELDRVVIPALIPNDPVYINEWHPPKIGAPSAWNITQGNGIAIAILDSGVDNSHPDLASRIVPGWNLYDNNSDTSDVVGHGTSVAGTAAAISNNSIGVAGVAGQSRIMPLRATDTMGYGYYSTISQGITFAADHGARIVNASFVGITSSPSVQSAAQYMKDNGGLVTTSAGNTFGNENFAITTTMIPVSATDINDVKTNFSSYGDFVALAAPGDGIWTTRWGGGNYWSVSGTSFASPITAGVIALMMAANPQLSSNDIENLLFATAVDLGTPGRDPYYGYGRVDAAAAVHAALNFIPEADTESPSVSILDPLDGTTVTGLVPVDIEVMDNIGLDRAELWVNNSNVAVDTSPPFAFSWDSSGTANGKTDLVVRVFDTANNTTSSRVQVTVDNPVQQPFVDTAPPVVEIINPIAGNVSGNVAISISASDNSGAAGITLSIYIDNVLKATGNGSTLGMNWNTRSKGTKLGTHTIQAIAKDAAGNTRSTHVSVNVVK